MESGWEGSSSKNEMLMNYFSVDEDDLKTFDIGMAEVLTTQRIKEVGNRKIKE